MTSAFTTALFAAAARGVASNVADWTRLSDWRQGDYIEVQAFGADNVYAHTATPEELVAAASSLDAWAPSFTSIHVIGNLVPAEVAQRYRERPPGQLYRLIRGESTTDKDIARRDKLFIDVDSVHAPGTSSTGEELVAAIDVAEHICHELARHLGGYDALAVGLSGNGCSIFLALNHLGETPELRKFISAILHAIKALYDTDRVKIDAHLSDPKRLVPLFGTVKRKGPANDPLRPHRRTGIIVPPVVRRLTLEDLARLRGALEARLPPKPAPPPRPMVPVVADEDDLDDEGDLDADLDAALAATPDGDLDFKTLRKYLVRAKRKKAANLDVPEQAEHHRILTAILDGTALAESGARAKTLNLAASLLASWLPLGTPWESAIEILRPSVEAMDLSDGDARKNDNPDYWLGPEQAQGSYNRALGRAFERDAEKRAQTAVENSFHRALMGIPTSNAAPANPTTAAASLPPPPGAPPGPPPPGEPPVLPFKRNTDGAPVQCSYNIYVAIKLAPETAGFVRWNEVTRDIEITGGAFVRTDSAVLATEITYWLQAVHGLVKIKEHEVERALLLIARENRYDPIKEYLNSLVWDGVPRLERFFFDYVKARTVNEDGSDITAHLRRIGRKFFIGGAARPLHPGCQNDSMLVLEGKEGKGKTSAFRILFGIYYAGAKLEPGNKDTLLLGSGNWGIEFGELAAMGRAEDETLKFYVTTLEDKFRPPYGRRIERTPRRCVLVGTTNEEHWLTHGKGLRRYWPVYVEAVDLVALEADRDRLWAEAVARFRGYVDPVTGEAVPPEPWHLTDEEWEEARQEAATRISEPYLDQKVQDWYYQAEPGRRGFVTVKSVMEDCLGLQPAQVTAKFQKDVEQTLRRLGFSPKKVEGGRRGWVPTEEMVNRPRLRGAGGVSPPSTSLIATPPNPWGVSK